MKYIKVYGLRRGGNHIVANWIIANHRRSTFYLNDVPHEQVLSSRRCSDLPCFAAYESLKRRELFQNYDLGFVGFENRDLDWMNDREDVYREYFKRKSGEPELVKGIVVRDYFNLMASIFKSLENGNTFVVDRLGGIGDFHRKLGEIWADYSSEVISPRKGFVPIIYDFLVKDRVYRDGVAHKMGFVNLDMGIDQVPVYGCASSFDGTRYDSSGRSMATSDRWKSFAYNEGFRKTLNVSVIIRNYVAIYGETEALEHFRSA